MDLDKLLEEMKGQAHTFQDGRKGLLGGFTFEAKAVSDSPDERVFEFVGSDETIDRSGDVVSVDGWDLESFRKNPVILFGHQYGNPPVGKAVSAEVRDVGGRRALAFKVEFAPKDTYEFADTVRKLVRDGYMKATSVGFIPHAWEDYKDDGQGKDVEAGKKPRRRYTKQELLELSIVPVPANPNALQMAVSKGVVTQAEVEALTEKGVIPHRKYALAPDGAAWDAGAEVGKASVEDLRIMSTWFNEEAADVKGSYKLPHHKADGYSTVWRGVAAAMGALLGARGGVAIPAGDKRGVYNHLAAHYKEFDKVPPEFRDYDEAALKTLDESGLILLEEPAAPAAPAEDPVAKALGDVTKALAEVKAGQDEVLKLLRDLLEVGGPTAQPTEDPGESPSGTSTGKLYEGLLDKAKRLEGTVQRVVETTKGGVK